MARITEMARIEIEDAINKLVERNLSGLDGIYAEHLKYGSKD